MHFPQRFSIASNSHTCSRGQQFGCLILRPYIAFLLWLYTSNLCLADDLWYVCRKCPFIGCCTPLFWQYHQLKCIPLDCVNVSYDILEEIILLSKWTIIQAYVTTARLVVNTWIGTDFPSGIYTSPRIIFKRVLIGGNSDQFQKWEISFQVVCFFYVQVNLFGQIILLPSQVLGCVYSNDIT